MLNTYAPDFETFSTAVGEPNMPRAAYDRVLEKLRTEPVEDFRMDFEDGYGTRSDAEEDGHAVAAARAVESAVLPPFFGIRIKPLTEALRARGLRTLELFLKELKTVPEGFIVTLPKVTSPGQVAELVREIPAGASIEIMVETPEAIVDASGRFAHPGITGRRRRADAGRCISALTITPRTWRSRPNRWRWIIHRATSRGTSCRFAQCLAACFYPMAPRA